jgi:hypothetical protein
MTKRKRKGYTNLMKDMASTSKWFTEKRKHHTHALMKEMASASKWFTEYWIILAIIFVTVASVGIYFQWILTTLSP